MLRFFFKWLFIILDTPWIGWSLGEFNEETLLKDSHTRHLAQILEKYQPELFSRWRWIVLASAKEAKLEKEKLKKMKIKLENLLAEVAKWKALINDNLDTLPPQPKEPFWYNLLSLGLSYLLFLSICEFTGIDTRNLVTQDWFFLLISFLGAICINLGEKLSVEFLVATVRRYEPRRNYKDSQEYQDLIPFWCRYTTGDPAIWYATILVALETGFAGSGLLGLLPPQASKNTGIVIIVFLSCGLAALVNVALGWGIALNKISWLQQKDRVIKKREEWMKLKKQDPSIADIIEVQLDNYRSKLAKAQARQNQVAKDLKEQEKIYTDVKERARLEYERWEIVVRKWLKKNQNKIEQFPQSQSSIQPPFNLNNFENNGHQKQPSSVINNVKK